MNPTTEELSDFWQDVLHRRCQHSPAMALLHIVELVDRKPNTSAGRFAQALITFLANHLDKLSFDTEVSAARKKLTHAQD